MKKIICIMILLTMGGCTVQKVPVATGGSRSDGVITMTYQYGMFDKVEINWGKVKSDAARKCAGWGYSSAEPFGGLIESCVDRDCNTKQVSVDYQCTGL